MVPAPRLVLFDLVGTLLRVEPEREPYWLKMGEALSDAKLYGAPEFCARYAASRPAWHELQIETPLRARLAQFAVVPDDVSAALERDFVADYKQRSSVIDGVETMLAEWRAAATLGVVSNFFIAGAPRELLAHHGLLDHFSFVIDSAQVGYRKPSARIFECATAAGGVVERENVVMIGDDAQADVDGAQAFGLRAVLYASAEVVRTDVPVIKSWAEFRPAG